MKKYAVIAEILSFLFEFSRGDLSLTAERAEGKRF